MHIPVLKKEVLEYFNPQANQNFIDCTVGEGGHTSAILEKTGPDGKVLGIERDSEIYQELEEVRNSKSEVLNRLILINDSYINLKKIVEEKNFKNISGIVFDLGYSSWHVDKSGKGFTFSKDEFLDMRYSSEKDGITAQEIINNWSKENLEEIFKQYGEERFSKIIAQRLIEKREIKEINTTFDLVEIIKESIPLRFQSKRIHPATKVFQALRIAVNDELENLKNALPQAIDVLNKDGKIIVISFHSLEDRIVKHFFKNLYKENKIKILTKKPIMANGWEVENNPRSRSAKLRAVSII